MRAGQDVCLRRFHNIVIGSASSSIRNLAKSQRVGTANQCLQKSVLFKITAKLRTNRPVLLSEPSNSCLRGRSLNVSNKKKQETVLIMTKIAWIVIEEIGWKKQINTTKRAPNFWLYMTNSQKFVLKTMRLLWPENTSPSYMLGPLAQSIAHRAGTNGPQGNLKRQNLVHIKGEVIHSARTEWKRPNVFAPKVGNTLRFFGKYKNLFVLLICNWYELMNKDESSY